MLTGLWLVFTTVLGYFVGAYFFASPWIGGFAGFGVGIVLRFFAQVGGDIFEGIVDSLD